MEKIDEQLRRVEKKLLDEQLRINKGAKNVVFWTIWTMVAIAISTLAFAFFTISNNNDKIRLLVNEIEYLSEIVYSQNISVSGITEQISESPQSVDVGANIIKIVEKLDSDYKKLQEIVIGSPANIIEFALLIKEVDNLKESYKEHKASVYEEMNRNFGLFRWFIYMNILIALALLGMIVTIYYQSRPIQKSSRGEK